ncbi:MAG: GDSL-type esterase/lipase family protein [Bacteroidota bacterium]
MKKIFITTICIFISYFSIAQNFIAEIKAFETQDSLAKPKVGQILLAGSSSFRIWKNFKEDLTGFPVINRGFGGSQMSDLNFYFDRIIAKYEPKLVLVYEGDNDLSAGKTPETILEDYKIFTQKAKNQLPKTKIVFMSVRPSLSRIKLINEQRRFNKMLKAFCKTNKNTSFFDIQKEFYLPNGELMPDIFIADQLHLNPKGYEIWTVAIRKVLKKRFKS